MGRIGRIGPIGPIGHIGRMGRIAPDVRSKGGFVICHLLFVICHFPPPPMSIPEKTLAFCRRSLAERDQFWTEQSELIFWHKSFHQVCDFTRPPFARWFVGGETNLCYNAIDRHLTHRADQVALHFISTEVDTQRSFTYRELADEVAAFAAVLQSLGLKRRG